MTHDNSYMDFVVKYTDYYLKDTGFVKIDEKGEIISTDQAIGMEVKQMNDSLCESIILFDLKNYNGKEKYKNAIDFSYNALMEFGEKRVPGTNCFWHKEAYTDQLWLDGFYMYAPFYARYAKENNSNAIFDEITDQFQSARALLRDDRTGLYYHGYAANYRDLSDDTIFWANRETGRSQSFWGRGLGWYVMALVDILEYFPEGENKESLKQMLNEALTAVYNYRDIETNMYYNVLNYNELDLPYDGLIGNNYLETSGSSMISYAMIKGARLNYIDKAFKERGLATFDGIYNHSFNNSSLGNICKVAGLGGTKADGSLNTKRTGTPRYYCSEKIVNDDAKGVGPFIMAFMEYLKA